LESASLEGWLLDRACSGKNPLYFTAIVIKKSRYLSADFCQVFTLQNVSEEKRVANLVEAIVYRFDLERVSIFSPVFQEGIIIQIL